MHSIDWEKVGDQKFNVFDPVCGFWTDEGSGFVNSQYKAKTYTQDQLTEDERKTLIDTRCILMSSPDPAPLQKPENKSKNKDNNKQSLESGLDM